MECLLVRELQKLKFFTEKIKTKFALEIFFKTMILLNSRLMNRNV
ncbi:hypothetical protein LEP1GSC079_2691 [Leptospira interrogans str. FPW1039]|uniref:Uncharacterized protein n=1 Tax=Leptospira interrogans str. FPW1039 TaxID=1193040 RepID=A0A0F6IE38_LEPIR|nr:hypothetical protein LEP1GSC014_3517 [Leptospira interrogans serovar Pomona str. Pomona]EKR26083.1 hypothetical protein LEP1GSC087_4768 [Leptospira interrogans serovar Bataviae str. L1111]EKR35678.1 hypothetical protein LEP1GSC096_4191 [Leptospira interrogans serovar Hebdomadis str. R499]EKR83843.1 hypothetical protein LEP1GSC099_3217 [Leptospira interrogans str. UI 08452]EMF34949.1 hypothetical protein LEP1GSC201_0604 [Leptospira interrogans serovar Pomona str. Fox 32256]EMI62582.1 hypothe